MLRWVTALTRRIECGAAKSRAIYWLASRYYLSVIRREIKLAGITEGDRVLCIGGGACPFSAILLHQATGAMVTVIDNNAACISHAREVVERLGLSKRVRVLCQDGASADLALSGYSVIHFALQVCPMERVFSQVESQVAHGTRLLVRRPKSCLSDLYSHLPKLVMACCRQITHNARNIGSTLLYVKGERLQGGKMAARGSADSTSPICHVAA